MDEFLSRTEMLLGAGTERLINASIAIFGLGGVGSYTAEALARAGIGRLVLVDPDIVSLSNCNRQLVALRSTVGKKKTEVMAARIKDINPHCKTEIHTCLYMPETGPHLQDMIIDYVVDAVDTVKAKVGLIREAHEAEIPIISAMGTGNKLYPEQLRIADIYETEVCPLARVMRRELRKIGIVSQKVVYSPETPIRSASKENQTPGSVSFVPSVAGLLMAGEVIRFLAGAKGES